MNFCLFFSNGCAVIDLASIDDPTAVNFVSVCRSLASSSGYTSTQIIDCKMFLVPLFPCIQIYFCSKTGFALVSSVPTQTFFSTGSLGMAGSKTATNDQW